MVRNEQRTYKNMATEKVYIIPSALCTINIIPNLHRTSNLLPLHPALYSLTQKAVRTNTCRIVRKFLTEQRMKNVCQVRPDIF